MADSLIRQLMSKGEGFFTEVSNNLLANPAFIEVLKKGIAAKEAADKQVAEALKKMNVATRKDLRRLEDRIAELESKLAEIAEKPAPRRRRASSASD